MGTSDFLDFLLFPGLFDGIEGGTAGKKDAEATFRGVDVGAPGSVVALNNDGATDIEIIGDVGRACESDGSDGDEIVFAGGVTAAEKDVKGTEEKIECRTDESDKNDANDIVEGVKPGDEEGTAKGGSLAGTIELSEEIDSEL